MQGGHPDGLNTSLASACSQDKRIKQRKAGKGEKVNEKQSREDPDANTDNKITKTDTHSTFFLNFFLRFRDTYLWILAQPVIFVYLQTSVSTFKAHKNEKV